MIIASIEWTDVASAWSDMVMVVISTLTLAGVAYVAVQVALQRTQMHRDLENLYVERYWSIMDRLEATDPGTRERERAVLAYLALSEDQCDLRADGRVTSDTWRLWGQSILGSLLTDEYRHALASAPDNRFVRLRKMLEVGSGYDPTELTRGQQKRRGL